MLLALAGLAVAACGKRGPPVAPERRLPATISALAATVEGSAIVLSWTNPATRGDGTPLKDLTLLRVYRREESGEMEPKPAVLSWGNVVGYSEVASIKLGEPGQTKPEGNRAAWVDRAGLSFGRRYVYVVTAVDSIGRSSPPSGRVLVTFLAAPMSPRGLSARAGDGEVQLAWLPPSAFMDGTPLPGPLTYQVFRAPAGAGPFQAVTPTPISEITFADRGLENERTYYYVVRALRSAETGGALSEPTPTVAATPVDLTPPSPPTNVVAIPSESTVHLAWNPSPEADVAGYAIYRASPPGSPYVRIATVQHPTTVFTDRAVERGRTYSYVVTAVDRASRPNESARSDEAQITVP